jgi:hypothetical protein
MRWLAGWMVAAALQTGLQAAPAVPYRAWQFHKLDVPYVTSTMKLAKGYDVNTVVFSHDMIGYASQLLEGRALAGLRFVADLGAAEARIRDKPPASARLIRAFADDLEARLSKLE